MQAGDVAHEGRGADLVTLHLGIVRGHPGIHASPGRLGAAGDAEPLLRDPSDHLGGFGWRRIVVDRTSGARAQAYGRGGVPGLDRPGDSLYALVSQDVGALGNGGVQVALRLGGEHDLDVRRAFGRGHGRPYGLGHGLDL